MRFWILGLVVVIAGCTKDNPAACADGHCADPSLPFCDVDGALGGTPNTCIAVSCTASQFASCRGDSEIRCNTAGNNYDLVECPYGCGATGCNPPPPCMTPDCEKRIVPKYLTTVCDQLATTDLTISASKTLDTSNDLACASVVAQVDAPDICVLHYNTITIERNQTYKVTGNRVLALVADRDLVADGVLDVSADGAVSGPGGDLKPSGTNASTTKGVGGGGAGYRHKGGDGGTATMDGGAADAGAVGTSPKSRSVLDAGTHPAKGLGTDPGGGGGGVTLISCRSTVSVLGVIDAGGGGGAGDYDTVMSPFFHYNAAGGGSGGTVVLQGMQVSVTGEIYANGGGGGGSGGVVFNQGNSGPGGDGGRSTTAASGGGAVTGCGGGGYGGTNVAPANGAAPASSSSACAGAGGGAAGYILVYVPQSVTPTITPVAVSPSIESTGLVPTN